MDWQRLLDLAEWHRSTAWITDQLSKYSDVVPAAVSAKLRDTALETLRTNLGLASELIRVSTRLSAQGIPCLAYKGPVLAQQLYGDVAARVTSDIDILVDRSHLEASRDVLLDVGYDDKNGLNQSQQAASFRYGFEHSFCVANGPTVDLHWRVVPFCVSPSLDMRGIWDRASTVKLFDQDLLTFGNEDLVVALCLHAGQHEWAHIGGLTDIARLLSLSPDLNWEIISSHLRDSHTLRVIAVSLWLVHQNWAIEIPEKMLELMRQDHRSALIASHVRESMWPRSEFPTSFKWALQRSRDERWPDRSRFLSTFFRPSLADFIAIPLPKSLIGLYPILRLLRLALKYTVRRS